MIYGLSTMGGRLLNYLLVPLHTRIFGPVEYGVIIDWYAYVALINVFLTYGMETAFFRFCQKAETAKVFATAFNSIFISSIVFFALATGFSEPISSWLEYQNHPEYLRIFAGILALDAIAAIPFALLRQQNRPLKFAIIKNVNIGVNILLNLYFLLLCPWLAKTNPGSVFLAFYDPSLGVSYVFYAGLVSSLITIPLLWKEISGFRVGFDMELWKQQFRYAFPVLIAGAAAMINDNFSRNIFKFLLGGDEHAMAELGIFGANVRFAVLMNLFVQAFRFAGEPFFFSQAKHEDRHITYARVTHYFGIACLFIFLLVTLFIDQFKGFLGSSFHEGVGIVPILLLANMFLGMYYNLSIWYKLGDKTVYGAYISLLGVVLTIGLNIWLIPRFGYFGAAWVTFITYFSIAAISYWLGQKNDPVPYKIVRFFGYLALALAIYFVQRLFAAALESKALMILIQTLLLLFFTGAIYRAERNLKFTNADPHEHQGKNHQ